MEKWIPLLISVVLGFLVFRLLALPVKLAYKAVIHSGAGFLCLWLLNGVSYVTGIAFPINPVTVLTAGVLGLPGIAGLAVLQMV